MRPCWKWACGSQVHRPSDQIINILLSLVDLLHGREDVEYGSGRHCCNCYIVESDCLNIERYQSASEVKDRVLRKRKTGEYAKKKRETVMPDRPEGFYAKRVEYRTQLSF